MTFPPSTLRLQVRSDDRNIRLWLPLFLLWPLALLAALVLAPLVVAAAIILWPRGWGRPLLLAGPLLLNLLFSLRGLRIRVDGASERVFISFV